MSTRKDKFLGKIVKKDYNDELEKVLETKDFDENVKSTLLSIFYKIEAAYADVETVKRKVETKQEYVEQLIDLIAYHCHHIRFLSMSSKETSNDNRTFTIDKEKKTIECYPIDRKILYAIGKISKRDRILKNDYHFLSITLSNLITVGHTINLVEPLRDFNGYSWTTIPKEIESIDHNLIYQVMRMLLGYQFLNKWITNQEYMIDYFELCEERIEEEYGVEITEKLISLWIGLSVLLEKKFPSKTYERLEEMKENVKRELATIQDKEQYIIGITKQKTAITEQIREIDTILNSKDKLQNEYIKRNETLPLEKKIFSMRILGEIMMEERGEAFEQMERFNELLKPQHFVLYKRELEEKNRYLILLDAIDLEEEIKKQKIELQKVWIQCFEILLEKVETKQEMMSLVYQFRYYCLLPFDFINLIYQVKELKELLDKIQQKLIEKANELKIIPKVSKNKEINYQILQYIFRTRIIHLEDLTYKITKEKENIYFYIFEETVCKEKILLGAKEDLSSKDFEVRFNKRMSFLGRFLTLRENE